ncbi:alpha/beta hydrolase [Streptomyces sp. XM83C]|uniref:alpha/beta fold hydrolase n=1 Tax=Streptomyces sp. XM83C TaxID=2929781 RepID=UPI001FFA23EB|nr:alpha/beta fold hydrolase [Streptomyces sp. XM83C]MCK1818696.1 alpha/beta hydrolase [Streptomyces sp. XM83C]
MTAFVLVPGMFTDGHVWEATAARLGEAGAEAHPVRLEGPPGAADLDAHIAQVFTAIDAAGRDVVLVGHDYGMWPVLGAADLRADRIARIVFVDTAMPPEGSPALAAVPDQELRARLAERAGAGESGGVLPPPSGRAEWERWGSTAGVSDAALDRLTALARPQPLGTLLQPPRRTGAAASVPTTGVLCTAAGVNLALLQQLVDFGDPAMRALAAPGVTFFELPTGHWPMLSCPDDLAEALLGAAAGEGRRLVAAGAGKPPAHLRPFPLAVPEVPGDRRGDVDLYVPSGAGGPLPAVVFVHGGPVPAGARPTPREWPTLVGYARAAAARGVIGVTVDHRLHDVGAYPVAARDVADAVELVRSDPRVDAGRIALWFFSGGGPLSAEWLESPPAWLRAVGFSYPLLVPMPDWGLPKGRFRPVDAVCGAGDLPLVLLRAGREAPALAAGVEEFRTAVKDAGARLEVVDVPNGRHAFESLDPVEEWGDAVRYALDTVTGRLTEGAAPGQTGTPASR